MKEKTTETEKVKNGKKLQKALLKKALGYDFTETVMEYVLDDEGIKLSKKKVTKKNVPPDMTALKMLLCEEQTDLSNMTDEELEKEKLRLISILAEENNKE